MHQLKKKMFNLYFKLSHFICNLLKENNSLWFGYNDRCSLDHRSLWTRLRYKLIKIVANCCVANTELQQTKYRSFTWRISNYPIIYSPSPISHNGWTPYAVTSPHAPLLGAWDLARDIDSGPCPHPIWWDRLRRFLLWRRMKERSRL